MAININNKAKVSSIEPEGDDNILKVAKKISIKITHSLKVNILLK